MLVAEKVSLGEEIDRLFDLREKIKKIDDSAEELRKVFVLKEVALLARIEEEGMSKAVGQKASVSITESVVPQVENWDEFYAFLHRNKAYHLLERRPAAGAYRELIAQRRRPVPGVVPFTKRRLSLRTV
jgi:hypothetical protein